MRHLRCVTVQKAVLDWAAIVTFVQGVLNFVLGFLDKNPE